MEDSVVKEQRRRSIRKTSQSSYIISRNAQNELRKIIKKISEILKKPEQERTTQDKILVKKNPELVKVSQQNARKLQNKKERVLEVEDDPQVLLKKCDKLADLIKSSKSVIVYTGAGISTAASIPDYRGPNGVWTLLKKGQELSPQDLSDAEPTFTHMSLTKLFSVKKVKHIVSQNCDGLHLRSGFPRQAISEVHGNMYIECCYSCDPNKEFVRLFDVTERTGFHRHVTSRHCHSCGGNLQDTIVHFGERGKVKSPYRWKEAVRAAKRADLILCLGSSLKPWHFGTLFDGCDYEYYNVLRKYSCLWCMDKKRQHRPKLVIVNLQWTPKDDVAALKINGKCDTVMMNVMSLLNYEVPEYKREQDPIFWLYTPLRVSELKTTNTKILIPPAQEGKKSRSKLKSNTSTSATRRKSCRATNSAQKHALWPDKKYSTPLLESFESNYFILNDESCKEMEKYEIYSNQENLTKEDITVPPSRLKLDQHKSAEYNNYILSDLHTEPLCDMTDLQLFCFSDEFSEESFMQSELLTCTVPQKSFLLQMTSNHHWCDCKIQEGELKMICPTIDMHQHDKCDMHQHEKCRSFNCCSVRQGRQTSAPENNGLYTHDDYIGFQNKSVPELVVVNLGKNESQKCIDHYIFKDKPLNAGETVLFLSKLTTDNSLSNLLVADVYENSSSSTAVYNSSNTLGSIFCHQAASDILTHSNSELNESSVHMNFKAKRHVGKHFEVTSGSDIKLLPARSNEVFDQCTGSLFSKENSEYNNFGNNCVTIENNQTKILTNNIITQQFNNKTLHTFQSVRETIVNICHDHCYTSAETTVTHQQKAKLSWIQTANSANQLDVQNNKVDMSTKVSSEMCPFADDVSHSVNYKQAYNFSKLSIEANKLQLNTHSLQIKSLHMSVCTCCRSIDSSALECHSCSQTEGSSSNPSCVYADQRQQCDFSDDVPTCILNMDDMKIVYTEVDNQPELSLCFSDDNVSGHTIPIEPADITFPWNYDILVLPRENGHFHLCQYKNNVLPDPCYLVMEKSTFRNESHVDCLISNDLAAEPKLHSCIDTRCQKHSSSKNSNTDVPEIKLHSFPEVEKAPEVLCNIPCDKTSRCLLRDTYLKFQHNLEKKEVAKTVMKKCHQVSDLLHVQKGNKHGTEGRENVSRQMCRRKPAVPGWFGKGLTIKKKRKY